MIFRKVDKNKKADKNRNIFDVPAVLSDFYALTHKLSALPHLHFKEKHDDGDTILWNFVYRGNKYMLQFSIYNGLSIYTEEAHKNKEEKAAEEELNTFLKGA